MLMDLVDRGERSSGHPPDHWHFVSRPARHTQTQGRSRFKCRKKISTLSRDALPRRRFAS